MGRDKAVSGHRGVCEENCAKKGGVPTKSEGEKMKNFLRVSLRLSTQEGGSA